MKALCFGRCCAGGLALDLQGGYGRVCLRQAGVQLPTGAIFRPHCAIVLSDLTPENNIRTP